MRLLIVSHYFASHRGGIEIVADQLAQRIAQQGHEVVWLASEPSPMEASQSVERIAMPSWNGIEEWLGIPYPLWSIASYMRLGREIAKSDVVQVHEAIYLGSVGAFLAAKWFGKPFLVIQHIGEVPFRSHVLRTLLWLMYRCIVKSILRHADAVAFISERVLHYFSRFVRFRGAVALIPNGFDTELFMPVSPIDRKRIRSELDWELDRPYFLFVGRFVEKKGLLLLREVVGLFPDCRFVFIGWGNLDPATWNRGNTLCIGQIAHQQLVRYYQAADVLILPSVGEGFPLVVQEAMACGLPPLVSTEIENSYPRLRELAFGVQPTVKALAEKIQQISNDPSSIDDFKRGRMSQFARENWGWEKSVEAHLNLISEVTRQPRTQTLV